MAAKRPILDPVSKDGGEQMNKKKMLLATTGINLGAIATEEELDVKVLRIQNSRLFERLEEKNSTEEDLRERIAELERTRDNDQIILSAINHAWNQLNEDVGLMLQRFEEIPYDDIEGMSETTVAFLEKLSNRTTTGISEEIQKRVANSANITKRLVRAIEKTYIQSESLRKVMNKQIEKERIKDIQSSERSESSGEANAGVDDGMDATTLELSIHHENEALRHEKHRLHEMVTLLHERHAGISGEHQKLKDELATTAKELNEVSSHASEQEYELQKVNHQVEKLIKKLSDLQKDPVKSAASAVTASEQTSESSHVDDEIELLNELAKNRLVELESLQKSNVLLAGEYEKLKQQLNDVPDGAIVNSTKYKMLQTQYNLLFNDAQIIRKSCEDARKLVMNNRNQHIQQVEQLEVENGTMRRKVRAEVGVLEKQLTECRKDLELVRIEYEHNMKAHEQVAPMAKEMRDLVNSLRNHNQQLKGEVQRYKRKLSEAMNKVDLLQREGTEVVENPLEILARLETPVSSPKSEESHSSGEQDDTDDPKVLRTKLRVAREKRKEMKLLLDMYKGVSKETRAKAELLKNEKKLKDELITQRSKMAALSRDLYKQSKKLADEEAERKIRKLNDVITEREKQIANTKQEEDALLAEMEFTGQAFEEMQEQNIRLMQQLREKDDTNLKLMSERIKASKVQKLLREEKEVLVSRASSMGSRQQAIEEVVRCLEEREKVLQSSISNMEKENLLRQQAVECHKRKAVEVGQTCQELAFKLEQASKQIEEYKTSMVETRTRLEEESFKCNRMSEENLGLKRKLNRAKKMEYLGASDEILVEEVKMYKGKLQCPCCNTRQKDAILTKCFHVFCFECLKTRYDTRQRKCPKCNATFGNNDFHKIYM